MKTHPHHYEFTRRYGFYRPFVSVLTSGRILVIFFILTACEQVIDVELPYNKKIVVNAFVGDEFGVAWISRTVPIGTDASSQSSAIMDAEVKMKWQDSIYILGKNYSSNTFLFPTVDSRWQGDSLTLMIDWSGMHAASTARMPKPSKIKKVYLKPGEDPYDVSYLYAVIEVDAGVVVWTDYSIWRQPEAPMGFGRIPFFFEGDPDGVMREIEIYIMSNYNDVQPGSEIELSVYTADRVYNQYLKNRYHNNNEPFTFGGTNPQFNVTGDGIGLFIPVSVQTQRLVVE
ncbi:MAG: DUF4249 family protein [Ignavibacteria bacterium]|nr:DUF4249 family protein [Ignavibacteria bacterium]